MEAKRKNVNHVVVVSSCYSLLGEDSPHYTQYAITKRHADELATYYCKANSIPLSIVRPSQLNGDSYTFKKNQPFFYFMIDKAKK
jgi:nucleoside-diphosphate-sugar epimerase